MSRYQKRPLIENIEKYKKIARPLLAELYDTFQDLQRSGKTGLLGTWSASERERRGEIFSTLQAYEKELNLSDKEVEKLRVELFNELRHHSQNGYHHRG